eukprot:TRINITY_DN2850_c1_g1_i1.p1 TRINITY_DN2850_c1_g1~~TRINITY_DN2850_c1_g1_i1.p1  ORF type:complete len:998 (+),score=238.97 TRINITY_DN2850_c1_g1_i1:812-3805(+)
MGQCFSLLFADPFEFDADHTTFHRRHGLSQEQDTQHYFEDKDTISSLKSLLNVEFHSIDNFLIPHFVELIQYGKGAHLFNEHDILDHFFIILDGFAHIKKNVQGETIAIAGISSKTVIGLKSIVDNIPVGFTVETAIKCNVLKIDRNWFKTQLNNLPRVNIGLNDRIQAKNMLTAALDLFKWQLDYFEPFSEDLFHKSLSSLSADTVSLLEQTNIPWGEFSIDFCNDLDGIFGSYFYLFQINKNSQLIREIFRIVAQYILLLGAVVDICNIAEMDLSPIIDHRVGSMNLNIFKSKIDTISASIDFPHLISVLTRSSIFDESFDSLQHVTLMKNASIKGSIFKNSTEIPSDSLCSTLIKDMNDRLSQLLRKDIFLSFEDFPCASLSVKYALSNKIGRNNDKSSLSISDVVSNNMGITLSPQLKSNIGGNRPRLLSAGSAISLQEKRQSFRNISTNVNFGKFHIFLKDDVALYLQIVSKLSPISSWEFSILMFHDFLFDLLQQKGTELFPSGTEVCTNLSDFPKKEGMFNSLSEETLVVDSDLSEPLEDNNLEHLDIEDEFILEANDVQKATSSIALSFELIPKLESPKTPKISKPIIDPISLDNLSSFPSSKNDVLMNSLLKQKFSQNIKSVDCLHINALDIQPFGCDIDSEEKEKFMGVESLKEALQQINAPNLCISSSCEEFNDNFNAKALEENSPIDRLFELLIFQIFDRLNFFQSKKGRELFINPLKLRLFIAKIRNTYQTNPYHCWSHAVDVLQAVFVFISSVSTNHLFPQTHILALLISALGHDAGHPGFSNEYSVCLIPKLKELYPDQPVLEAQSVDIILTVLQETELLDDFKLDIKFEIRSVIKELVMATAMSNHFQIMERIKPKLKDLSIFYDTISLFTLFMKAADISNPARSLFTATRWSWRLQNELFFMYKRAKEFGGNISSLKESHVNQDSISIAQGQVSFIKHLVRPLFADIIVCVPLLNNILADLTTNQTCFSEFVENENEKDG